LPKRDDAITLLDVIRAGETAVAFVGTMDLNQFSSDEKTQSAVIYQLMVMGEAVKRLSESFRAVHPGVPFKEIAGMRDVLIHWYDEVKLDVVFKTVTVDVPAALAALK
jgi:uncharacterized protein with HEPN domain